MQKMAIRGNCTFKATVDKAASEQSHQVCGEDREGQRVRNSLCKETRPFLRLQATVEMTNIRKLMPTQ